MKRLILRPLNRVKLMIWPKMKLGIIDVSVFCSFFFLCFVLAWAISGNVIIRIAVAFGVGGIGGVILLMGEPSRRVYNYFWILISFLISKKKYRGDEKTELNPYHSIDRNLLKYKDGKNSFVYRIIGNNINYNLDSIIKNKLESFSELFQGQSLSYQIVKEERKFDDESHRQSLRSDYEFANDKQKLIIKENLAILDKINDGDHKSDNLYTFYFLEFSSSSLHKLRSEELHIENALSAAKIGFKKLKEQELALYALKRFLPTEINKDTKITINESKIDLREVWIDVLKDKNIEFKPNYFQIGKSYQRTISIDRLPLYSSVAFLAGIFNLPNCMAVMQVRGIENTNATKMLNKAYQEMKSRTTGGNNKLSESSEQNIYINSMEELMDNIQGHGEELKIVNIYINIFGKDFFEFSRAERQITKAIRTNRMKVDKLLMKQLEAWTTLPTPSYTRLESRNQLEIGTEALSHSWPFILESFNDPTGDFIGMAEGGQPSFLDWRLRSNDLNRHQSNAMIFGTTGAGKTTFTKKIIKDEWSRGVTTYILDPEGEYNSLLKSLNAVEVDLSGNKNNKGKIERLNPLQVFVGGSEETGNSKNWIANHFRFLSDFFSQLLYPSQKDCVIEMSYLNRVIQSLYKDKKIDNNSVLLKKPSAWPTITDVYKRAILLSKKRSDNFSRKEIYLSLAERLYDFTNKGTLGVFWDGPTTLAVEKEKCVIFNFKDLINGGDKRIIAAQSYLTYKYLLHIIFINKDKKNKNGKPPNVSITIDEAHRFINPDNYTAVLFAFSMYKQIRKYHGWIRMTTQNIADFTYDEIIKKETSAMLNNSKFLFIFRLSPSDIKDLNNLLRMTGGLTNVEKRFLARETSHEYLLISGGYRSTIKSEYSDFEKEIFWNKG